MTGPGASRPSAPRVRSALPSPGPRPLPDVPAYFPVELDPSVRRPTQSVLIGGSPLRMMHLSPTGAALLDRLEAGERAPCADPSKPAEGRFVRRLLDAGIAHPKIPSDPDLGREVLAKLVVVIPVRDRPEGLSQTLAALDASVRHLEVVVVDDASADAGTIEEVTSARRGPTRLLRRPRRGGPAAARNTGWRAAGGEVIAFLDADCEPSAGWLAVLLAHLDDPCVGAVAPRVVPRPAAKAAAWLSSYEMGHSPLDCGGRPATVRPRSPVPYVPAAALLVRRQALEVVGGFDEDLHFGEDVDFVWRLGTARWRVRYEPRSVVTHPVRSGLRPWLAQRYRYGSSAAPLAERHGDAICALEVSGWSLAIWTLVASGHHVAAGALGAATSAAFPSRVGDRSIPRRELWRLAALGNLWAGKSLAEAIRRSWWPLAAAGAIATPRLRKTLVAAVAVPVLLESWPRNAGQGWRWLALRLADDMAYGAGVWAGACKQRSAACLLPRLSGPMRAKRCD